MQAAAHDGTMQRTMRARAARRVDWPLRCHADHEERHPATGSFSLRGVSSFLAR
jgi:hypothetical protein